MRRPLLEEDNDEASEQGGTGMASPLDGLDLTDPYAGQQQAGAEWDQNEGFAQGDGEWNPAAGAQEQVYDDPQQFDDGQPVYDGQEQQPQWENEPQYAPPPQPRRPQRPVDPALSETERRFAKYGFYKLLVQNPFFANDGDPVAADVEMELQTFVQGRMKALLGGEGGVEAPIGFSNEEAAALKAVALSLIAQQQGRAAPQQRRQAQQRPRPPAPPPLPSAPTRRAPVSQQQARPPARPQVAPRPRPAAPIQPPRPPQLRRPPQLARQPEPQRRPNPQQRQQQPQPEQRRGPPQPQRLPKGAVPADESIVEENGRTYKILHREAFPGEYGPKLEATMRRLPVGMHTRLSNGVQILRGGPEEWIKVVRRDLTPQHRDRTQMPFPRNMKIVTAELADSALQNVRLAPGLARVISRGLE